MNDRFKKQTMVPAGDQEKFNLACNLLTKELLKENPGMELKEAMLMAHVIVSEVMNDTIKYRGRMKRAWDFCTAIHYN